MDKKLQTVETYNKKALEFAAKFGDHRASHDVAEVFSFLNKINPVVFEIGCANGRDAREMIKFTNNYLGIDISEKLIEIARANLPGTQFEVGDIETYTIPSNLDIVFAFASLIHVSKDTLAQIFTHIYESLNKNGVFRLSMKYAEKYEETTTEDEFGVRTYYLYSDKDIADLAHNFSIIKNEVMELRGQKWVETLLQKKG